VEAVVVLAVVIVPSVEIALNVATVRNVVIALNVVIVRSVAIVLSVVIVQNVAIALSVASAPRSVRDPRSLPRRKERPMVLLLNIRSPSPNAKAVRTVDVVVVVDAVGVEVTREARGVVDVALLAVRAEVDVVVELLVKALLPLPSTPLPSLLSPEP
jgi:hypothetical protein